MRNLADWLAYQERLHPNTIDLGLDRLTRVLARLEWRRFECPVIIVGGTNGKGSCVALLESILTAGGYRVGTFTSPHLIRYNERIRIGGREISDESLVAAFERIEAVRGDISLTFFEFNTLAVLLVFATAGLDAAILEVGLGGRLDAVNVVSADATIVSSIALDHCDWLGNDVESIAREKAGIFRAGRPAIFGAREMPASIATEAQRIGARLLRLGVDFDFESDSTTWSWQTPQREFRDLPAPALPGAKQLENASAVLAALDSLRERLPLERAAIESGLRVVELIGRFQRVWAPALPGEWVLDVAHNPAAAETLASNLAVHAGGRTIAICGMFADKDVDSVVRAVAPQIDLWVIAGLSGMRALAADQLAKKIALAGGVIERIAVDVAAACRHVRGIVNVADRVVIFGSFYTVGPALEWLEEVAREG